MGASVEFDALDALQIESLRNRFLDAKSLDDLFRPPERLYKIKEETSFQVVVRNTEAAILARAIEADESEVTPDVARYLLPMQLPQSRPRPGE